MARKTVLKLLLAKYGPKSIEIQQAIIFDQATTTTDLIENDVEDAEFTYVDNEQTSAVNDLTAERLAEYTEENDQ